MLRRRRRAFLWGDFRAECGSCLPRSLNKNRRIRRCCMQCVAKTSIKSRAAGFARLASLALASAATIVAPGHAEDAPTPVSHPAPGDPSTVRTPQVGSLPVEARVGGLSHAA